MTDFLLLMLAFVAGLLGGWTMAAGRAAARFEQIARGLARFIAQRVGPTRN